MASAKPPWPACCSRILRRTWFWKFLKKIRFSLIFYGDRARYAFQTQIFFLLSRYHQQKRTIPDVITREHNLIADYTFEKDALFAGLNLNGDELDMYYRVHEALAEKIVKPGLIVYLRAATDVLMQRIAQRDRPYERDMDRSYIHAVNQAYENHFSDRGTAVLVVDTNELNYVRYPEHLEWVENRIRQALKLHPYQTELPLPIIE